MKVRSARKDRTRRLNEGADQQRLEQEVTRLRGLLREAQADTRKDAWAKARRQFKLHILGLGLLATIVGGVIGYYGFRRETSALEPSQDRVPSWAADNAGSGSEMGTVDGISVSPWPISVYVSGAVAKAQVVELPAGSLVADALDRVGGTTGDADLDAVNLAAPVTNNQHIVIPRLPDRRTPAPGQQPDTISTPAARIDINTAPCDELENLPYIGPSKAADIVSYRTTNGPFDSIEDIQNVPGIGPATYEHIAHLITIEH